MEDHEDDAGDVPLEECKVSMKAWLGSNGHPVERLIVDGNPKRRKTSAAATTRTNGRQELRRFLVELSRLPYCYNMDRNSFNRSCSCCQQLTESMIDSAVEYFAKDFCLSDRPCRQVIEKAMIKQSEADRESQRQIQKSKKAKHSGRYKCNFRISFKENEPKFFCTQTWRVIYCIRRTRYNSLKESLKTRGLSPSPNKRLENNNRWKSAYDCRPDVVAFLEDLKQNYSEPTATRFVRLVTGTSLRDDQEVFELPPSYTKRKLYERYCFERGHKVKADAGGHYPKVKDYPPRDEYDEHLWPVGSVAQPVCSWFTFRSIWKSDFKSLKIRNASEDICGECVLYQNRWRHKVKQHATDDTDSEPESEPEETQHNELNSEDDAGTWLGVQREYAQMDLRA